MNEWSWLHTFYVHQIAPVLAKGDHRTMHVQVEMKINALD